MVDYLLAAGRVHHQSVTPGHAFHLLSLQRMTTNSWHQPVRATTS